MPLPFFPPLVLVTPTSILPSKFCPNTNGFEPTNVPAVVFIPSTNDALSHVKLNDAPTRSSTAVGFPTSISIINVSFSFPSILVPSTLIIFID